MARRTTIDPGAALLGLGILGLGAYLFARGRSTAQAAPTPSLPARGRTPTPTHPLPTMPSSTPGEAGPYVIDLPETVITAEEAMGTPVAWTPPRRLGDPLDLLPGRTYRARIELSSFEQAFATKEAVRQRFQELGFRNVQVAERAAELDPSWPVEARTNAGPGTRWAIGTWGAAAERLARPPNIAAAWEG